MWGSNSEEVRLADLGVLADGATDNAAMLLALRNELRASPERHYRFVCPPGEIRYSDPRWLMGLQNFTVVGYGTRLVSSHVGGADVFKSPLLGGDIFETNPFAFNGGWTYEGGKMFHSAPAGAYSIGFVTIADALLFEDGKRVFLGGFDQQGGGYPPNWRYFEWKTIAAVDISAGTITFNEPLLHSYDEDWHDVPNILGTGKGSGKPRMVLVDRDPTTISYPRRAEFVGVAFGLSTDASGFRGAFHFPAEVLRCRDVTVEGYCWPSQHRTAEYVDCSFIQTDLDKLCDVVRFVRPKFGAGVNAATGINDLYIEGGSAKGCVAVAPRRLHLSQGFTFGSNDINPSLGPYPLQSPVERMELNNVRFASGPSMGAGVPHGQYLGEMMPFVVSAVDGGDILIPFSGYGDGDANWRVVRSLDYGMTLKSGSKSGVIDGITFDATSSRWVISGSWTVPIVGETWRYPLVREIVAKRVKALDGRTIWDTDTAAILTEDSI